MTQSPAVASRLSKSSLFSLIFGILGCLPFVTGALAMLLGLIGFFRAGKPGVRGRWMAVVGGLLGTASVVIWTLFSGVLMASILGLVGMAGVLQAPGKATHDFIHDLSAGTAQVVVQNNPMLDEVAITQWEDYVKKQGTFIDTTFPKMEINNDTAHVEGTAQFSKGTQQVTADLQKVDGKWQVVKINIKP